MTESAMQMSELEQKQGTKHKLLSEN